MISEIGKYLWWLFPAVRKLKPVSESILAGFLDAIGMSLDRLKQDILIARLRRYVRIRDANNPYYSSKSRSNDLELHATDRGLWRLPGETDENLAARILELAYANRFLGTKSGMRYLVEIVFKLKCNEIVEYYADHKAWIILSDVDQQGEAVQNLSHLFSDEDQEIFQEQRQTRAWSERVLNQPFHFWMGVSNPDDVEYEERVVREAIDAAKPAHTVAVVNFF